MQKLFSATLSLLAFLTISNAGTIKGKINDSSNKDALEGVSVFLKGTNYGTLSGRDGQYTISGVKEGKYTLVARVLGYEVQEIRIEVEDDEPTIKNFQLVTAFKELEAVEVIGKVDRESNIGARKREKDADNVLNVVSSQAIDLSPDLTIASVVQRVSGVTLDRSTDSQRQYAIVRGMEQRYNNTLINGIKIPSPDPESRFVPLNIIPAELVQRMEITKSLTPDMEGDAIGGTVNAVMKEAPDTLLVSANASAGYSQLLLDRKFTAFNKSSIDFNDPDQDHGHYYAAKQSDFNTDVLRYNDIRPPSNGLFGITLGQRFINKKLGMLISATNQRVYSASNSIYDVTIGYLDNKPSITDLLQRSYSTETNKLGINTKIDYVFNPKNKISLYNLYLNSGDIQSRYIADTSGVGNGRVVTAANPNGYGSGFVSVAQRSRYQIQIIENATLQGQHLGIFKRVNLDWSLVYSNAVGQVPDMTELNTYHTLRPDGHYLKGTNGIDSVFLSGITHTWQKNTDRDIAAYINLEMKTSLLGKVWTLRTGGLYRDKYRINYQNDYNLRPVVGFSTGTNSTYNGLDKITVAPYQPVGNPDYNNSNYTATENIFAYYLQGKTSFGRLHLLTGARLEVTGQSNRNNIATFPGFKQHFFDYVDVLPSLHLNYVLSPKENLRFSVFKSISRPGYYELVDYTIRGNSVNQSGNPNLRRAQATSYDLRYEIFPNAEEVLMVGIFYKNIVDPIERLLQSNGGQPTITFGNFGTATNYGIEFNASKYFGNFGVSGNFTYINSSISSPKLLYVKSIAGADTTTLASFVDEKRPMQGQSKIIANATLLYRNSSKGLNIQLAFVFQGKRINQVSNNYGLDFYQSNYPSLSFSFDKRIHSKVTFFGKLNNLINTPFELYTKDGFFIQRDIYKQEYLLGLKYKL